MPAAIFEIGTSSRNPIRGPSYRNVDIAITRRFPVTAGTNAEFRVEVFNALNTTQFGNPNAQSGNAAFGTITTAGDPRTIQLAVRFSF